MSKSKVLIVSDKVLYRYQGQYYTDGQTPAQLEAFATSFNLHVLMPVIDIQEKPRSLTRIYPSVTVHAIEHFKYFLSVAWPWQRATITGEAKRCFSRVQPHVVIGKFPREVGIYGVIAAHALSIPTIVNYSYDWLADVRLSVRAYPRMLASPYARWIISQRLALTRKACKTATKATSVSKPFCQMLSELSGRKVLLARNAYSLSPAFFDIAPPSETIGDCAAYIGRVDENKNVVTLIRALADVRKTFPAVRLLIAGDGPDMPRVRATISELDLANAVELLGYVKHDRLPQVLTKARVLALPSQHEALGQVLLEAMAAGRPVIASRVGGITEIVSDGKNGLLVSPQDKTSICNAICRVFQNKKDAIRMGANGRRFAQQFRPDVIHGKWLELISDLTDE